MKSRCDSLTKRCDGVFVKLRRRSNPFERFIGSCSITWLRADAGWGGGDIRAGVALLIAALSAEGKSVIQNIEQIDRGYQNIDERLRMLGADIKRI